MAINNFINLDKEDALTEPEASLLQEIIKALIIALYNALDNKESTVKPPYNDIGYITISSILRSTPLIKPFLV